MIKTHLKNQKQIIQLVEKEGVPFFQYEMFSQLPEVIHGFSTRMGGVSEGIYTSMNLSFSRGDEEEKVIQNYKRMGQALGVDYESFTGSVQTHTTNVRQIMMEDRGSGISKPVKYQDVDGMITNVPGITLTTYYADCVPLYFVDPIHKAIGLSHSGWRGTVGKMGKVTLESMKAAYGTDPKEVYTAIGPSICQECYEVSKDVIEEFQNAFPKSEWSQLYYEKGNGRYQLDLWRANELILLEAGVEENRIATTNICTCCDPELLFSHRASKGKRGNLAAFLALK